MILQALKEYYDRKPDLPRPGFEQKEIPFVIVLDRSGTPINVEATTETIGKKKRAKTFLVPQAVKRSSGIASNILWDKPDYALGVSLDGDEERVKKQHTAFLAQIAALGEIGDVGLDAVRKFLARPDKIALLKNSATRGKTSSRQGQTSPSN